MRPGAAVAPPPAATAADLVRSFDANAAGIHTLLLSADIGSANVARTGVFHRLLRGMAWLEGNLRGVRGKSYLTVSGYLLLSKPDRLRVFGTVPLVGGRAFDLASDGDRFELSLPTYRRFVVGRNACVPADTRSGLQRLRPGELLQALPVFPVALDDALLLGADRAGDYELRLRLPASPDRLRVMIFDRGDLRLRRQIFYNTRGARELEVNYADYSVAGGVAFPRTITLDHPGAYSLLLQLTKPPAINAVNPALANPATFQLAAPAGARLLDQSDCQGTA